MKLELEKFEDQQLRQFFNTSILVTSSFIAIYSGSVGQELSSCDRKSDKSNYIKVFVHACTCVCVCVCVCTCVCQIKAFMISVAQRDSAHCHGNDAIRSLPGTPGLICVSLLHLLYQLKLT